MHYACRRQSQFFWNGSKSRLLCGTLQLLAAAAVLPWFTDRVFDCAAFWPRLRKKYRRRLGPKCAAASSSCISAAGARLLRYRPWGWCSLFSKLFDANNIRSRKVYLSSVRGEVSIYCLSALCVCKLILFVGVWERKLTYQVCKWYLHVCVGFVKTDLMFI